MKQRSSPPVRKPSLALATPGPSGRARSDSQFLVGLGQGVRTARERRGLSRKALSGAAGVSERYLAALELGEGNASVTLLRRVAAALGMRLTDLFEAEESEPDRLALRRLIESLSPERVREVFERLTTEFGQDETVRRSRIALIGLRGAGKSTLGRALAQALGRTFVELDEEIERAAGMGLSEVFLLYGQAGYRRLERRCLERLIGNAESTVVSIGGGVVSEPETFDLLLRNCYTVWIKARPAEHMARVLAQGDLRPMAGHAEAMEDLKKILSSREALYSRADAVVDTSGATVEASFESLRRLMSRK